MDGQAFEVKEAAMSSVDWGASAYLSIVRAKLFFVLGVLRLGNNVLLSDVDIVFNDDPVPDIVEGVGVPHTVLLYLTADERPRILRSIFNINQTGRPPKMGSAIRTAAKETPDFIS